MEAVAEFPFQAKDDEELSFSKTSMLKILDNTEHKGWYKAELNGRKGYIPANHVKVTEVPFATKLDRDKAEAFLLGSGQYDGSFLVRPSSFPGDFTLSVKDGNRVQHYRIIHKDEDKYWIWNTKFDSINELIRHYRFFSLSQTKMLRLKDLASPLPIGAGYFDSQPIPVGVTCFDIQTKVVGKCDFKATSIIELEMKKGDIVTIISKNCDRWWYGEIERDNQKYQGFFLKSHVESIQESKQSDLKNIMSHPFLH